MKPSTIHAFVRAQAGAKLALDALEIAQALWLSRLLPATADMPAAVRPSPAVPTRRTTVEPPTPPPVASVGPRSSVLRAVDDDALDEHVVAVAGTLASVRPLGRAIRLTGPHALDDRNGLAAALRPFARKRPSVRHAVLDEAATVDAFAANDGKMLLPVMAAGNERWFDALVLVERAPSIDLWAQHIREFVRILADQTAFGEVRQMDVATDGSLTGFVDASAHRLVFLVSDCTSAGWSDGRMSSLLAAFARRGPVALLHLLPPRLWERTGIVPPETEVSTLVPGVANGRLRRALPWWADDDDARLPVPVIGLDAARLASWAQMVMATGGARCEATLVSASSAASPRHVEPTGNMTADERVARFARIVSPTARKLAASLSTAPLTLPVMRLVQQAMHPESGDDHLAEVFLGGLIERVSAASERPVPDDVRYEFHAGVRERLWTWLDQHAAERLLVTVGRHLARHADAGLDFDALLVAGDGAALPAALRPFARIAAPLLKRLGHAGPTSATPSPSRVGVHSVQGADFPRTVHDVRWSPDGEQLAVAFFGGIGTLSGRGASLVATAPSDDAIAPFEIWIVASSVLESPGDLRVLSFLTNELPATFRARFDRDVRVRVGAELHDVDRFTEGQALLVLLMTGERDGTDFDTVVRDATRLRTKRTLTPWMVMLDEVVTTGEFHRIDLREGSEPGRRRRRALRQTFGVLARIAWDERLASSSPRVIHASAWDGATLITSRSDPSSRTVELIDPRASTPRVYPIAAAIVAMLFDGEDGETILVDTNGSVLRRGGHHDHTIREGTGLRRRLFGSSDSRHAAFDDGDYDDDGVTLAGKRCALMPDENGDAAHVIGCVHFLRSSRLHVDLLDDRGRVSRFLIDPLSSDPPDAISVAANLDPFAKTPGVSLPESVRLASGTSNGDDGVAFGASNGWVWVSFAGLGGVWLRGDRDGSDDAVEALTFSPSGRRLAVAAGTRVAIFDVADLRRAVSSRATDRGDTAPIDASKRIEAWRPGEQDLAPTIEVLQALALAFHVRSVFPNVTDDDHVRAFFELDGETELGDFHAVRGWCEWIFKGAVRDYFNGTDLFASLRPALDEAIASSGGDDAKNQVRHRDYQLERLVSNLSHLLEPSAAKRLAALAPTASSDSFHSSDPVETLRRALDVPELAAAIEPWLTKFHAGQLSFPGTFARLHDMASFIDFFTRRWLAYLDRGVRRVDEPENTLVRIGFAIERTAFQWMRQEFPDVAIWPGDTDRKPPTGPPSTTMDDAERGMWLRLADYRRIVERLAWGLLATVEDAARRKAEDGPRDAPSAE